MTIPPEDIRSEITAINLKRMWWILIATTSLTLCLFLINVLVLREAAVVPVLITDLVGSGIFIVLTWFALRQQHSRKFANILIHAYVVFFIVLLDWYYFSSLVPLGQNTGYLFGFLVPAVLLLIAPIVFLPLLVLNHAFYCVYLVAFSELGGKALELILVEATSIFLLAALANWLLYRTKWSELENVREVAQQNEKLSVTVQALTERNEEMDELMAITAHDLRAPLSSMKTLLEMEVIDERLAREQKETLQTCVSGCDQMLRLVNRVLQAHEAEHRFDNLQLEILDLGEVFRLVTEQARPRATTKGIQLQLHLPDREAPAMADRVAIEQVLANLISNALKFSPENSSVHVALQSRGNYWYGEVRDQGPGISPADQASLFRKFQRGANLPTGGETSSGLGLFIAHKLMTLLGGSLTYLPGSNGGSIFQMRFPKRDTLSEGDFYKNGKTHETERRLEISRKFDQKAAVP